jgi:hypothetical protein
MIGAELPQGSSPKSIEGFLERHELHYSYDRFSKRYQSIIRNASADPRVDHAIVIYLYVDDAMNFTRAEVRDSYTAP